MSTPERRDFFVGYLPAPRSIAIKALLAAAGLIVAAIGTAGLLARGQLPAGEGQWQAGTALVTEGYLTVAPYPVLHTTGPDATSMLMVRPGKHAANDLAADFANQWVAVSGAPIERGGWHMVEATAIEAIAAPANAAPPGNPQGLESVTLTGEIADSKCYLGVMKPGAGKIHRACAANCLTGGLPPMLVVTDEVGDKYGYLLVNADGSSASLRLVPDVAVPVRVSGMLERHGDLTYLRLADDGVARLTASAAAPAG